MLLFSEKYDAWIHYTIISSGRDISEWSVPALEYTTARHGPRAPLLCGEATIGLMHGNYSKESQFHTMGEMGPARGNSRGHQKRKTNEPDL